jgi:hypothetical protein
MATLFWYTRHCVVHLHFTVPFTCHVSISSGSGVFAVPLIMLPTLFNDATVRQEYTVRPVHSGRERRHHLQITVIGALSSLGRLPS